MHKPIRSGIAVIGWGLLLAGLSACGGGAVTQAPTQVPPTQASVDVSPPVTVDPCAVVTQDDATAFFGAQANPGMPSSGGLPAFCIYATADNTGSMSVNLSYHANGAVTDQDFVSLKSLNQDVPDLGDEAFFDPALGGLTVAKGPWIMRVSGSVQGALATLDMLKPLVQTALTRLP